LDLSGSVAEKVQNPANFPKKEQLTRMKREFCPVRDMICFLRRSFTASSGVPRRFVVSGNCVVRGVFAIVWRLFLVQFMSRRSVHESQDKQHKHKKDG
jgi:hypothetical protein